jgi:glyoxylase-like metal-dependent hydrolase (beta-lactamase superfamily II)
MHLIDLHHLGQQDSIASYLLPTPTGALVVDPGPASTLPALRAGLAAHGLGEADLSGLLLTHIHLDHAGASGVLAQSNPRLRVQVHAKGAPHLIDPARLIGSAQRLYGNRMGELWGDILPVPAEQVDVLQGGEVLDFGGRRFDVAYTPGHAWHHVSYFDRETRTALVGDTAGVMRPSFPLVLPVTPPPDIDIEAWLESIDRILAWRPERLGLTHFGLAPRPEEHLEALRRGLVEWAGYAREALRMPGSEADRQEAFVSRLRERVARQSGDPEEERYLSGSGPGPEACWTGLARYWRQREG